MSDKQELLKSLLEELSVEALTMGPYETIEAPSDSGKKIKWVSEEKFLNLRLAYKAVEGQFHHAVGERIEKEVESAAFRKQWNDCQKLLLHELNSKGA
jgi:hypothetical protein